MTIQEYISEIQKQYVNKTYRVWINDEQYCDNVPLVAWEFYIGVYQPAHKWLKDRRDRTLSCDDIMHYQRIIKALVMTSETMETIGGGNLKA